MAWVVGCAQHKVADLDARLSSDDRALLIALLGLVESRLAAATNYFTWGDRGMFSEHTRHAYGAVDSDLQDP